MAFGVDMTRLRTWLGALGFFAVAVSSSYAQEAPPRTSEVEITAVKCSFDPNTVRVKKGDRVKLVITATDRDYGFKLAAFHIEQKSPKGEAVTVEFTADQTGTFPGGVRS
jgi:plastocyanin domain-containing protein